MPTAAILQEYDARVDGKRRLTIRGAEHQYFRVVHRKDGTILLKPRVLKDAPAGETALTVKPLPVAERKASLAALVKEGKVSAEQAKLIDFRKPTKAVRVFARKLEPMAREILARKKRAAA